MGNGLPSRSICRCSSTQDIPTLFYGLTEPASQPHEAAVADWPQQTGLASGGQQVLR
jgi:hypothetical protein